MKVVVPQMRSVISDGTGGLQIIIPAKRNVFLLGFLGFWLIGWTIGEIAVFAKLAGAVINGEFSAPEHLFLFAWLGLWTVGGGFALYTWLWMMRGRERVNLGPGNLSIRREVFGFGRVREYDIQHVTNLRVAPAPFNPFDPAAGLQFWGLGGGIVAFDYGAKTFRFGASIDEAEGRTIVERLHSRHHFG